MNSNLLNEIILWTWMVYFLFDTLWMITVFKILGKMSDRKAVIKNADMSEEMQQDAVDCGTQALEKYNIEKVKRLYYSNYLFTFLANASEGKRQIGDVKSAEEKN